ncbi:type II toxin-antitoxin system VapC family toxin [Candidatus Bathyarchaeota archaeon]|jgi:tRNA(fMet)-specific endonuclease VapC|nr:type II toxin-antitoxin system VapC family toxin [Candidatus Bathyarchaeota archaeon]
MSSLLIDTNIYTHALKGDPQVVSILQRASGIAITSISLGELLSGFKGGNQERKNRAELDEFLDAPRVSLYGVTENTAEFYADILNRLKEAGKSIPTNDIWIAAIAFEHGFKLFSKDRHFQYVKGLILAS